MFAALRDTLVLLLIGGHLSSAQWIADSTGSITSTEPILVPGTAKAATTTSGVPTPTAYGNGTCLNRPINHLTHTLPLQCLRKDRLAPTVTSKPTAANATYDGTLSTISGEYEAIDISIRDQKGSNIATDLGSTTGESAAQPSEDAAGTTSTSIAAEEAESDTESPLDNANFLSFEEWKKQNLAKAGQSPDVVGQGHAQPVDGERARPEITNALDAMGEEHEIDLDFGFGRASSTTDQAVYASTSASTGESAPTGSRLHRSKDAGKTCKERTNYASFDCAANVLKSNPECKSASSVLVEHKDSYMLNICSAQNKFFIVELCDDIQIDTIVLANYEFFSSVFRQFRVSVSDRYPVKLDKWKVLGTFEARNTREIQAFLVENPMIWAKYLRIEVLSHYGNEYYCPVSLLRVHGTTMMQDYRHEEELARGEVVDDMIETEVDVVQQPTEVETNIHGETKPADVHPVVDDHAESTTEPQDKTDVVEPPAPTWADESTSPHTFVNLTSQLIEKLLPTGHDALQNTCARTASSSAEFTATEQDGAPTPAPSSASITPTKIINDTHVSARADTLSEPHNSSSSVSRSDTIVPVANGTVEVPPTPAISETVPKTASDSSMDKLIASLASSQNASTTETGSVKPSAAPSSTNSTKTASSSNTAPQQPQPSTQESFFKSITKRLQQLESNSTLSLQYIEEQSRILRDAFTKVEKRQNNHALTFLSHLNNTVMNELQGFRQAYDQLWQSTVIELENHREAHQREMVVLSRRLSIVADELLWQKRMGIVQSSLLLLCLGLVLFARPGGNSQDVPLMQQVMNRSQAALRAGWDSDPGSPPRLRGTPGGLLRHGLWRKNHDASDSRPQSRDGLDVRIEPPTPPTKHRPVSEDTNDEEEEETHKETQSSPTTPTATNMRRIALLGT